MVFVEIQEWDSDELRLFIPNEMPAGSPDQTDRFGK